MYKKRGQNIESGCALAALLVLSALSATQAQTTLQTGAANFVSLIRGQNFPVTDPVAYNAVELETTAGNLLYVDQDASLQSGGSFTIFTSMSWVSATRVSASLLGCDEMTTPVGGRRLIVQGLSLANVDLDTANVQIGLQPTSGTSSLTLNNASLTGELTPWLYNPVPFRFDATGTSQVFGWYGAMSSITTLNVAGGGSLRFKGCGDVSSLALTEMLYFDRFQNRAVVNGATLIVDSSACVFGRKDPLADPANQSLMTFSNNATLQLEGSTPYTKVETDRIVFQNSTLNLSNNLTRLDVRIDLELDNSSAFIADGARVNALDVTVRNNSTVVLKGNSATGIATDFLEITSGATLTLAGTGVEDGDLEVSASVYFPRGTGAGVGAIHVTDRTYLTLVGGSLNSSIDLDHHAILTTARLGFLDLQNSTMNLFAGATFTNAGSFTVQAPSELKVIGNATIAGAGSASLQGALEFNRVAGTNQAKNSLTTGNSLYFGSTAVVKMNFDPTGLTCDRLICSNAIDLNSHPVLSLNLINDQPLPLGTKFVLIDYRDYKGEYIVLGGSSHFAGYTNRYTFVRGINTYQLNYADDTCLPGSQQFVTLTVVHNPDYPAAGMLNVVRQGDQSRLLWSSANTNFILEATYSLAPAAIVWDPVSVAPVLTGDWLWVSLPMEPGSRFFRLRTTN